MVGPTEAGQPHLYPFFPGRRAPLVGSRWSEANVGVNIMLAHRVGYRPTSLKPQVYTVNSFAYLTVFLIATTMALIEDIASFTAGQIDMSNFG